VDVDEAELVGEDEADVDVDGAGLPVSDVMTGEGDKMLEEGAAAAEAEDAAVVEAFSGGVAMYFLCTT
jgi:hypothetical protein